MNAPNIDAVLAVPRPTVQLQAVAGEVDGALHVVVPARTQQGVPWNLPCDCADSTLGAQVLSVCGSRRLTTATLWCLQIRFPGP